MPSPPLRVETDRLILLGATADILYAHLAGHAALCLQLDAAVPAEWPPEHWDDAAVRWTLESIGTQAAESIWRLFYVLTRDPRPVLVGTCGFKGPPDATGTVEVGYSMLPAWQCRGFATEATMALIGLARRQQAVWVIADTYPSLAASIRVMEKCGMRFAGMGGETGTVRYRLALHESPG